MEHFDPAQLPCPILLRGDARTAYRDPNETKIFALHAGIGAARNDDLRRGEYPQEQTASEYHLQFPQIPTSKPITPGRLS